MPGPEFGRHGHVKHHPGVPTRNAPMTQGSQWVFPRCHAPLQHTEQLMALQSAATEAKKWSQEVCLAVSVAYTTAEYSRQSMVHGSHPPRPTTELQHNAETPLNTSKKNKYHSKRRLVKSTISSLAICFRIIMKMVAAHRVYERAVEGCGNSHANT